VFVLVFGVKFEVGYNPFIYKTQPQKLFFIIFLIFLWVPHIKLYHHRKNKHPHHLTTFLKPEVGKNKPSSIASKGWIISEQKTDTFMAIEAC